MMTQFAPIISCSILEPILIKKRGKSIGLKVLRLQSISWETDRLSIGWGRGSCEGRAFESPFGHRKHVSGHGTDLSYRQGPCAKHLACKVPVATSGGTKNEQISRSCNINKATNLCS